MRNDWDVPATPELGDRTDSELFEKVGRALTDWEHLESALGDLFAFFVGAEFGYPTTEPAVRAYGSVASFQARSAMLEEAASAYFHATPNSTFHDRFSHVIKRCRQFSGRRNDIAHGRVQQGWFKEGLGHFLMPSHYSSRKWEIGRAAPSYLYTSKEIEMFRCYFVDLYDDVAGLTNDLVTAHRHAPD